MHALKKIHILPALSITLLFLVCTSFIAHAQRGSKYATTEDIAIAFYKTGDTIPNFKKWITARGPYNETPWARRDDMMEKELLRLKRAYQAFNPEKDLLTIRTKVRMNPMSGPDENNIPRYGFKMHFAEAPDAQYFPYDFLGERIVVMPYKMQQLMQGELEKEKYNFLFGEQGKAIEDTMIFQLKAREADLSRPYKIDGINQWVLKADIASMELRNKQGRVLWEYSAPWYANPMINKLNKLYEEKPTSSLEKGSVKSLYTNEEVQ